MSGNASEFNSKGLILIANPSFEFYLSEGNIHFEAGSARVDSDSKCFVFSSNVLCLQPGLSAVRAQQACYHAGEDVIEVSKGFSIKNPDMVLSGDSAMIDRGDGRVDVEGVVEVEIWRE